LINQVLNSFAGKNPYPTQVQSSVQLLRHSHSRSSPTTSITTKTVNVGGMLWTKKSDGNWANQFGNTITNAEFNQLLIEHKIKINRNFKTSTNKPWWDIFGTQSKMNIPTQIQPQTAKAQFTPLPIIQPNIARDDIASSPETIVNTHIIAMTK